MSNIVKSDIVGETTKTMKVGRNQAKKKFINNQPGEDDEMMCNHNSHDLVLSVTHFNSWPSLTLCEWDSEWSECIANVMNEWVHTYKHKGKHVKTRKRVRIEIN